jgi:hypothetical protein
MTDKSLQAHDMSDVLEMAREAGFTGNELKYISNKKYEAFANLIEAKARADEREQCTKICAQYRYGEKLAKAIRERGE